MWPIVATALVVAVFMLTGLGRARADDGRLDPVHPLLYPTLYVAIATLAPAAWLWGIGDLGYVKQRDLDADTPFLIGLAVIGFMVGAAIPFRRRTFERVPRDPKTLALSGRCVLLLTVLLAAEAYRAGAVHTRGLDQTAANISDPIGVAAFILAPASVILIALGAAHRPKPFTKGDLVGIVALVTLLGLNGRRGSSIAVILMVAFAYAARRSTRSRILPLAVGGLVLLTFAYRVVAYRTTVTGQVVGLNPVEVLLRDLASVTFTTGITSRLLQAPGRASSYHTLGADLIRQLPSPIADSLLGPPTDTGAFVFRDLFNVPDSQGYGYSIPAEGVLNFGTVGAFVLPFVMGTLLAWLYARADFGGTRAIQLSYYLAVAGLPFAWRSDVLGAVKGVLYPTIAIAMVMAYASVIHRHVNKRAVIVR